MRRLLTAAALLLPAALPLGCDASEDRGIVRREGKADVVRFETGDPDMNRAIEEARRTFPYFLAALRAGKETQTGFAVKHPFREGEQVEHMWVSDLSYDGALLRGVLNNHPQNLRNLRAGQRVEVPPDAISDWMYVEGGKLVGGQTLRVMFRRYTPEERRALEQQLGFTVD